MKTPRSQIKRVPKRGHYDFETVAQILDAGLVCHVGFVTGDQPFVIPTTYGRVDNQIYIHGAGASRMLKSLLTGIEICMTVTLLDGLVLARSAYHHSMNYRSVVLFGTARAVTDPAEKTARSEPLLSTSCRAGGTRCDRPAQKNSPPPVS